MYIIGVIKMTDIQEHVVNNNLNDASVYAQSSLRLFVDSLEKRGLYNPRENEAPIVDEDGNIVLQWSNDDKDFVFTAFANGHLSLKEIEGNKTTTANYSANPFAPFEALADRISNEPIVEDNEETPEESPEEFIGEEY